MKSQTRHKGDISEAKVLSVVKELGYNVLLPFAEGLKYDLAIDTGRDILRVQVKSMWKKNGCYVLQCCSSSNAVKYKEAYNQENIDGFIGHNSEDGYFCWVPVDDAPSKHMRLRFQEPNNTSPNINWASNYCIESSLR
jgi:hypothetical protein